MTIYQQIELAKDYLQKHPCTCKKTSFFQISFPYCEHGYTCKTHCSLWFHMYRIDFERYHDKDPEKVFQLTLF